MDAAQADESRGILGTEWPVKVCVFIGNDQNVEDLAAGIDSTVVKALKKARADGDIQFGKVIVRDVHALAQALRDSACSILHIISHANTAGVMPVAALSVDDVWGQLRLDPADLAKLVRGSGVRLAIVSTCHGAIIANHLVEEGGVNVAIGMEPPQDFNTALVFSKALYCALAKGHSIRAAYGLGVSEAGLRSGKRAQALELFPDDSSDLDLAVYRPPDFFLFGEPSDPGAVSTLLKALEPHTGFHVDHLELDPKYLGSDRGRLILSRLKQASIAMFLFEGERDEDVDVADIVARAVHSAAKGEVRLFPVYLKGKTSNPELPFGLFRVVAAYLERCGRTEEEQYRVLGAKLRSLVRRKP